MKSRLGWLIFVWFCWAVSGLMALDPGKSLTQYGVRVWNIEAGLPGNSIYAICQTRDGYLWIGTQDGLARFDGVQFEVFSTGKTPGLKSNVIRALFEDSRGTLWIGTTSGGLTAYKNGEFKNFSTDGHKHLLRVSAISEDRWGNVWIGSSNEGLTCFDGKTFTTYTAKNGLPNPRVRNIHRDRDGDLWITTTAGIAKLERPGVFKVFASQKEFPYYTSVSLYDARTRSLWIGTGGNYLHRLQDRRYSAFRRYSGLPHPTITSLHNDRDGTLWIGTDGGGLTRIPAGGAPPFSTLSKNNGLECGFIYSIYEDRDRGLWIGTLDGGLHQLRDSRFITYTTREGLADDFVHAIYQSPDGNTYIGTRRGLNLLKDGSVSTFLTTAQGLLHNTVLSLCQDSRGYLWIGTGGGLHRFKNGAMQTFTVKNGLSDNRVGSILDDGTYTWIGTFNGLNRYHNDTGKIDVFNTPEYLPHNFVRFLFAQSPGRIWVCTEEGLSLITGGKPRVFNFAPQYNRSSFHCMHRDKDGVSWYGTDDGLLRSHNGKHTLFTVKHGLIDNLIYSILDDDGGYLWLAGRSGVSRVSKKELRDAAEGNLKKIRPDWYNESDGMKSRWCTGSGFKTRDGKLWYPTSMGVAMIDPGRIKKDTQPLPVIIEKLVADGKTVNTKTVNQTPAGDLIELGPGVQRLEFYYTGLCFSDPKKVKFKIKLLGYDQDWVAMDQARSTTYTGLQPREYTFQVIASNPDGIWNPEPASFSFYIKPFFYQTLWFYIVMTLIAVFIAWGSHRVRVRKLETRARELGRLVDERTRDLEDRNVQLEKTHAHLRESNAVIETNNKKLEEQSEQLKELDRAKSRFFANISHEFRTPLTLIMGPLEQILSNKPTKALERSAALMLRNSRRLLNLVNQLLELAKFESGKMRFEASLANLADFVNSIVMGFQPMAAQKNVELAFEKHKNCVPVYFDPEKLEKIVTNLLSNAFNYTPPGGYITVGVKHAGPGRVRSRFPLGCMVVSVRDTGKGIPPDRLPHIFDRFYHGSQTHEYEIKGAGIGLSLTKDLVALHHGEIEVRSSCADDDERGTLFLIRLPIGDQHLEPGEIAGTGESALTVDDVDYVDNLDNLDNLDNAGDTGNTIGHTAQTADDAETAPPKPGKIEDSPVVLVVEDNPEMRAHIKTALNEHFTVAEAADGKEGIVMAKDLIPDIIVSDLTMPVMDGNEMCRTLKKDVLTSHIPVILLTAHSSQNDMRDGLESGADDYVTKPFSAKLLITRIRNLIDLRKQLRLEQKNRSSLLPDKARSTVLDDEFYKKLVETIDTHMPDPEFNVDGLMRVLGMSQSSLYRKVQALTGQSAVKFLRYYRIKRAAQLLAARAGNVSAVAAKVGFLDNSHFSQCFKKQFKCSPSEYLKSGAGAPDMPFADEPGDIPAALWKDKRHPVDPGKAVVLVVEDDTDARRYIRESLEPAFRVIEAADGGQGIEQAFETVPDLIISDIMMPKADGFQLVKTLKNDVRTSHIPVILLSSRASSSSIERGLESRADDYITKPFNAEILRIRCRNLIHLRAHLQKKRLREMTLLPVEIAQTETDREFVDELNKVIAGNLSNQDFGVEHLAEALYMSTSSLSRKTHAITGESPSEYLRSRRLLEGARLLRENFGSVTEVALEVGFKNLSHFTRSFKEKFHQLPSVYMALE